MNSSKRILVDGKDGPSNSSFDPRLRRRSPPIFVHGPAGCGKTTNAAWIAEAFGRTIEDVVDGWSRRDPIISGKVHLCAAPPNPEDAPNAVIIHYDRLGQQPNGPIPPHVPFTCGTNHVAAQAVLLLVERNMSALETMNAGDIETLSSLVDEAGFNFALDIIKRHSSSDFRMDEAPF